MKNYSQFLTEKKMTVPKVITNLFRKFTVLQGNYEFDEESIEELVTPLIPDLIQFLRDFLPQLTDLKFTPYEYYDECTFNLAGYPFSIELGDELFPKNDPFETTQFYYSSGRLPLQPDQIKSLLEIFLQTLRDKILAEPSFYKQLSPRLQAYFKNEGQQIGQDFGFFEAQKMITHDQFGRDEVKHQQQVDKETFAKIYKEFGTVKWGKLNTEIIVNILLRNFALGKIEKCERFTETNRFRFLYDLWTYDIYFMFNANFELEYVMPRGRHCLICTPAQFRSLFENLFKKVREEITVNPSYYYTLPIPLQNYLQTDFKHLGTDFDFLA